MRSLVPWTWLMVLAAVAPTSTAVLMHAGPQEPGGAGGPSAAPGVPRTHVAPAQPAPAPEPGATDSSAPEAVIRQALSAGPPAVVRFATVRAPNAVGRLVDLRRGTNGFTCYPDNPASPGLDPMCADSQAVAWMESLMRHEMRPGNTAPGIVYMLQGGSDLDAAGPWSPGGAGARSGAGARGDATVGTRWFDSPPHYMILWPFDPRRTGLSATPKRTGSWIMWSGTPYAHLMVNQVP